MEDSAQPMLLLVIADSLEFLEAFCKERRNGHLYSLLLFYFFCCNSRIAFLMMPGLKVLSTSIMYCLFGMEFGMYFRIISVFGCFAIKPQIYLVLNSLNLGTLYTLCTLDSGSRNLSSAITSETNLVVISF